MSTTQPWIRFSQRIGGADRFDVDLLHLTEEDIAALLERPVRGAVTHTGAELLHIVQWPEGTEHSVYYVRMNPASDLGRQDRDLLLGAGLIRLFDIEPLYRVHKALDPDRLCTGVLTCRQAHPDSLHPECRAGGMNIRCTEDANEVTCKACLAGLHGITEIRNRRALAALLPADVAERIAAGRGEVLRESAAALRVLLTIKNPAWREFVEPHRIDWDGMLNTWARKQLGAADSVLLRVEAAASLDRWSGAHPDLLYLCRALDRPNFLAVADAMRIIADGGLDA